MLKQEQAAEVQAVGGGLGRREVSWRHGLPSGVQETLPGSSCEGGNSRSLQTLCMAFPPPNPIRLSFSGLIGLGSRVEQPGTLEGGKAQAKANAGHEQGGGSDVENQEQKRTSSWARSRKFPRGQRASAPRQGISLPVMQ